MYKTLADMTPEERGNCQGMWATVVTERYPAVIVRTYASDDVDYAQMLCPELNGYYTSSLKSITPRPDLPRAWNPDGQPVPGEWETYREVGIGETFLREERRWVGDWEQA